MVITGHLDPLNLSLHINAFSTHLKTKYTTNAVLGWTPFHWLYITHLHIATNLQMHTLTNLLLPGSTFHGTPITKAQLAY